MIYANTQIQSIQADFPLEKELIRVEQTKELTKCNSNFKALVKDKKSDYNFADIDNIKLVLKDNKIYTPESMREATLNWYHYYLNHPGGDRQGNTIKKLAIGKVFLIK